MLITISLIISHLIALLTGVFAIKNQRVLSVLNKIERIMAIIREPSTITTTTTTKNE
jgi:hypothetical protein